MAFVELAAVKEKAQDPLWVRATQRVAKGPLVTSWRMRWRLAAALLMEMGYRTERQVAEMMRRVSVRHWWRGFNRVRLGIWWEFAVPDERFKAFLALKDKEGRRNWLKEGGTVLEVTADEVLAAPEAFLARAKGRQGDEEVVGSSEGNRLVIERLEVRSQRWEEDGAVAVLVFRPQDEVDEQ
jgi:hypothetical protein